MDGLFELRDDPQSYLYYYYSKQLHFLQKVFDALEIPFTLLDEWALQHSHPNLYAVEKLTYEAEFLSALISFLPKMRLGGEESDKSEVRHRLVEIARRATPMEKEVDSWLLHRNVDSYLTAYLSRNYSSHSWFPQQAFLASQRGNDSLRFEYICVVLPTTIVFIILGHSLSLLYSGSEEITPGLHFTAVGHQ